MQNSISEQARAAALAQLDAAEAAREDILVQHIANGVVIDSRTVQIDPEVVIAPGAVILAGTILRGKTVIGAGCVIGPNTLIEDSTVDEGTTVNASQIYGSHIGPHNNIGPFTHVRVNTVTDYGVHLGAYVETKNSNFARGNTGAGARRPHPEKARRGRKLLRLFRRPADRYGQHRRRAGVRHHHHGEGGRPLEGLCHHAEPVI